MARKSNAEIEREFLAKQREINDEATKRVQEMMPAMMASLLAELSKVRAELGPAAAPVNADGQVSTKSVLEGLAHAMAKASDPGNRRRIVAPEIMEARAVARENMKKAILERHAKGEMPVYKCVRATQLNEMLIQPQFFNPLTKAMEDQEIDWPHIPNQAMVPANEAAKEIHSFYLQSIGARAGHVLMGFHKLEGDNIEQRSVPLTDLPAPVVLSGKEIRRGHPGAPTGVAISDALMSDPRRGNPGAKPRVENVLGSVAAPAVMS